MKKEKRAAILVVDDEHGVRQAFNLVLKDDYHVLLAGSGEEALHLFSRNSLDLILLDIRLPDIDGIDLLRRFKETDPGTEVIMVTAVKEVQTAVTAIKSGAYEYIIKPFDVDEVLTVISRALEKRRLVKEVTYLRRELERYHPFEKMVGKDIRMTRVFDLIATIAPSDAAVLIQGESGTGKELVARAIHNLGPRKKEPFVVVSCAAIPPTMMESELFGHNRGAFTGAIHTNLGKLEMAHRGTVFLDDIDTMDIAMQAKLLRAIQEKEFERLGGHKIIKVDVRFIAASNKHLPQLIAQGRFREDLFYRLNVFPVGLPPLRERREDIPLLLDHFLDVYAKKTGLPRKTFSGNALTALKRYHWPGNVRELENLVERLCTVTRSPEIRLNHIAAAGIGVNPKLRGIPLKEAIGAFERKYIEEVLEGVGWNKTKAAKILGIHRNTLSAKLGD